MPRVKGGVTTRKRRKKILKLAKGYFGSRRTLYRTAHEQVMRSLAYAYRDRKQRKRNFRKLWISRINAAAAANGLKYSKFIHGLALANVEVNRKVLADLAVHEPQAFSAYVALAKNALENPASVAPKQAAPKAVAKETSTPKAVAKETSTPKAVAKETSTPKAVAKEAVVTATAKLAKNGVPANDEALKNAEAGLSKLLVADLKEAAAIEKLSETKKADLVAALAKLGYVAL